MSVYASKTRELTDIIWSVISSFGFSETEVGENEKITSMNGEKLFCIGKNNVEIVSRAETGKQRAELASICAEVAAACGLRNFTILINDVEVYDLLVLFGFEEYIDMNESEDGGFTVMVGKNKIADGKFSDKDGSAVLYFSGLIDAVADAGITFGSEGVHKNLIFAEEDAEGAAYDIAFVMRINGCMVEYFTADGTFEDAEKYARENGHAGMIRVFDDGKIILKDFIKNEIIETTMSEFLGYYDESDCDHGHDCDCGCGHHHGH